jgi:deoxyadenosine/deoxycytidine kinase
MSYSSVYASNHAPFITIAGIIGAGKTTFQTRLASDLGYTAVCEPVDDNQYLPLYYAELAKYKWDGNPHQELLHVASMMQMSLLHKRYRQHQECVFSSVGTVQDRSIYEDPIFANMLHKDGLITDLDFETYRMSFENMTNGMKVPSLIIYLNVTPETAQSRVSKRDRSCEKKIPLDYLRSLNDEYKDWLGTVKELRVPTLELDWEGDFDHIYPSALKKVKEIIQTPRCFLFK